MGGEQLVGIEVMMTLEQRAPHDGKEDRRDQELGKVAQSGRPELAALNPAIDELSHRLARLGDDLVVIKFGELRVLVALGDEKARDQHAARKHELLQEGEERSLEEGLAGQVGAEHAL